MQRKFGSRIRSGFLAIEIIAVGTELLLGQLTDTNSPFVAAALAEIGVDVFGIRAVGDNRERIAAAITEALKRADGVIITGGLGPTADDLTKEAVCDALGLAATPNEPALRAMEATFAATGRRMRENNRKQALLPRGALMLENPNGTAPGFVARDARGKFVASLPGVPSEMRPMLRERLVPWLQQNLPLGSAIVTRVLHTINIAESEIDHRIGQLMRTSENPKIAILAHDGRCDVKIMAKAESAERAERLIAPAQAEITASLEGHMYGADGTTLAGAVVAALRARKQTLAVAESCTGGRISAAVTAVPGASLVFLGGVVAYQNAVKIEQLDVPRAVLDAHGAVSERAALAMAQGARLRLNASVGMGVTGVAGPDGGTPEKPVGLVWLALADELGASARRIAFRGDRESIQTRATTLGLGWLWEYLQQASKNGRTPPRAGARSLS